MATQSRAQRRAHEERVKSRTRRVMRLWAGRRSAPVDPRELGVNASTHCRPCGCWMCQADTFVAAVGDLGRFETPRQLMAYVGLVPSEYSSGGSIRRGGITKTGNSEARRMLVEASWCYRYPARVAMKKAEIIIELPKPVRDIAWKAQTRLCDRFRRLTVRGKKPTVVATAVARELCGFIWAIGQQVSPAMP